MKKSEKRRIGEARQAENLRETIESGLKAQKNDHIARQKRKEAIQKALDKKQQREKAEKAKESMRKLGEAASKAGKSIEEFVTAMNNEEHLEEDYPLVLDMTDETAYAR